MESRPDPQAADRATAASCEPAGLAGDVAQAAASGVPLAAGLEALAEVAAGRRHAAQLRRLAARLRRGQSLEQALRETQGVPPYVAGLLRASLRSGDAGPAFVDLLDRQRGVRRMWRSIRSELAYAGLVTAAAMMLGLWILLGAAGWFLNEFRQMEAELTPSTQMLIWMHDVGVWWLLGTLGAGLLLCLGVRFIGGSACWHRLLNALPVLGPLWCWSGVAQLAWLLGILLERRVPLPEALRLTGGALADASLGRACCRLAEGVEGGQRFSEAVGRLRSLPATLVPLARWGERSDALPEAMQVAGDMFLERVVSRSELVNAVLPPLLLVAVGAFALALVIGLYAPMYDMLLWLM